MIFSPLRGPRGGIRTQIGLALGMPRESVPSAQELWDFLVTSTQEKMSAHERMFREAKNTPTKVSKANSHSPCPRHDIALAALSSLRTWQDRRCFLKRMSRMQQIMVFRGLGWKCKLFRRHIVCSVIEASKTKDSQ